MTDDTLITGQTIRDVVAADAAHRARAQGEAQRHAFPEVWGGGFYEPARGGGRDDRPQPAPAPAPARPQGTVQHFVSGPTQMPNTHAGARPGRPVDDEDARFEAAFAFAFPHAVPQQRQS